MGGREGREVRCLLDRVEGPDGAPEPRPREPVKVGVADAGGVHLEDLGGDGPEGRPVVGRGFEDEDALRRRLDADAAEV